MSPQLRSWFFWIPAYRESCRGASCPTGRAPHSHTDWPTEPDERALRRHPMASSAPPTTPALFGLRQHVEEVFIEEGLRSLLHHFERQDFFVLIAMAVDGDDVGDVGTYF